MNKSQTRKIKRSDELFADKSENYENILPSFVTKTVNIFGFYCVDYPKFYVHK